MGRIRQFLEAIKGDQSYAPLLLEVGTELRRGELLAPRWQDVNLGNSVLQVNQALSRVGMRQGHIKTALVFAEPETELVRRLIPIPAYIVGKLKAHKARQAKDRLFFGASYTDHDLVFCKCDGRPVDPRTFTRRFTEHLKGAGLPHVNLHSLRHSYATWLMEMGEHLKVVQVLLGHSKISITLDLYSHVAPEIKEQAAQMLNVALQG